MISYFVICLLSCLFFSISAIKHPDGFTNIEECIKKGATITYVLEEANGAKQFVLSLKNGIVVGQGGIVTHDGKILTDTETYKQDQQGLMRGDRDISKEELIYFDGTLAVISSPGQQCYYHWLLQIIPRLKILHDSNLHYDKIYVYADNFNLSWQKETLYKVMDFFGILHNKILFIDSKNIVQAKTLLVPSVPWIPSGPQFWHQKPEWCKLFFKNVFIDQPLMGEIKQTSKYVFISRINANYRRISNEFALMQVLNKKGFVSYRLEELSVSQQANLFNNAEVIIGPHGAGWTNLIFCDTKTKIVEIDHGIKSEEQRSSYKSLAKYMGCFYYPFYTDFLEFTDCPENILDPVNQDMTVDLVAFEQFLEENI